MCRTQLDTLRVNGTDAGADHSAMLMLPVVRGDGDHALLVAGQLANKERPYVRVEFPLTPGAIAPADLSGYTGVSFDVRGEAIGRLLVQAVPRAQYGCVCRAVHRGWRVADSENSVREFTAAGGQRGYVGREGRASAALRTGGNCRFQCLDGIGQRTVLLKEVPCGLPS